MIANQEGIIVKNEEAHAFTGAELDTLVALVENGPLWAGDVPSKAGRDSLISRGYAHPVLVKMEEGWTAAGWRGRDAYKAAFGTSMGGRAETLQEALANRLAQRAIKKAVR